MKWRALSSEERAMTLPDVSGPDVSGFEQVVLPHLNAAYNLARWLVRDRVLAEDVVQDATVRALGYFSSYRGRDGRAWLLRIVRNAAYTAISARKRDAASSLDDTGPQPDCGTGRPAGRRPGR